MGLMPNRFAIWGQRGEVENAVKEGHLLDCAECGSCVYVCPAKRNIVHYIKLLKAKNAAKKK
jgi:electron transport complex protein RnfC